MALFLTDDMTALALLRAVAETDVRGVRCPDIESAQRAVALLNENDALPEQWFAYKSDFVANPWIAAKLPQLNDKVSRAFNGDSYPAGIIVKIGLGAKLIVTSNQNRFYRQKTRPNCWQEAGSGFSMILGHVSSWNPMF
jgi:hypothetical protein